MKPFSMTFCCLVLLFSLATIGSSNEVAAFSPNNQISDYAQSSEYLPLTEGNKWVMHSSSWNLDLIYQVTQSNEGNYLLELQNPWITWETTIVPINEKIYISKLKIGSEESSLNGYSRYFDFTAPKGTHKNIALGELVILETNLNVSLNGKWYQNCKKIRITSTDGFQQTWTFAPGVGFIELSMLGETFKLNESESIINTIPVADSMTLTNSVEKGDRFLAIDINTAENLDFVSAFNITKSVGAQLNGVHFEWNTIETSPYHYENTVLDEVNVFYSETNTPITLSVAPIHSTSNNLPSDINNLAFNDPRVIERFKKLLDFIKTRTQSVNILSLTIGSEIDAYLGADNIKWQEYRDFYEEVSVYARAIFPGTRITTEFTYMQGFVGEQRSLIKEISQFSDVIGVSYYPRDIEGYVLDPGIVAQHFEALVNSFPDKPIAIYQLGYPSSTILESGEEKQALFVKDVFSAWDKYKDHIKLINFTFLHDLPEEEVAIYTSFFQQEEDILFSEFLSSLGLRKQDNSDKQAFTLLQEETRLRGWH